MSHEVAHSGSPSGDVHFDKLFRIIAQVLTTSLRTSSTRDTSLVDARFEAFSR